MVPRTRLKYAVFDLRTYFASQPGDITRCPNCASRPSRSEISPSRAVAADLAAATMPDHEFSRLYTCDQCNWWAIWESWGDREFWGQDFTALIVSVDDSERPAQPASPWKQALMNTNIYDNALPLPAELGQLFVGGKKKGAS